MTTPATATCTLCGYSGDTTQPDVACTPRWVNEEVVTTHQYPTLPGTPADLPTLPGWDTDGTAVVLAVIEHRHGAEYSVHRTHAGAEAAVHAHVTDWWDEEVNSRYSTGEPQPMPTDATEAITAYFDIVSDEYYTITTAPFGA